MTTPLPPGIEWGADCIGQNAHLIPAGTPALWPYVTGTPDVVWPWPQVRRINPRYLVRVNQEFGSIGPDEGDEFDVEFLAWTPGQCVDITRQRRERQWASKFYVEWKDYGAIKGELADASITRSVYYRIADWNLSQAEAAAAVQEDVYSIQWASPTSNPDTLFPGTNVTLAEMGADLDVLSTGFVGWAG